MGSSIFVFVKNMEDLRKSYQRGSLEAKDLTTDPLDLFRRWWHEAIEMEIDEANAMTLSTVNKHGQPSSRIVLLKGINNEGFEFFTNYQSQKAMDMEANPHVALLFFWKEMERQIRIEGVAEKVSKERSEKYFQSRPRGSQVGAWLSPQSKPIKDRTKLDEFRQNIESRFGDLDPLPLPDHWGGYIVAPHAIEFWQGRPDRLHDRFRYALDKGAGWKFERLAP